jgi:hypothetical protein
MAVNKKTDRVAGEMVEMVEMATLFSKRCIVSMKKLEAVHETASDLHLKLKAFDPNVHGGEVMSTGRVGAEMF